MAEAEWQECQASSDAAVSEAVTVTDTITDSLTREVAAMRAEIAALRAEVAGLRRTGMPLNWICHESERPPPLPAPRRRWWAWWPEKWRFRLA